MQDRRDIVGFIGDQLGVDTTQLSGIEELQSRVSSDKDTRAIAGLLGAKLTLTQKEDLDETKHKLVDFNRSLATQQETLESKLDDPTMSPEDQTLLRAKIARLKAVSAQADTLQKQSIDNQGSLMDFESKLDTFITDSEGLGMDAALFGKDQKADKLKDAEDTKDKATKELEKQKEAEEKRKEEIEKSFQDVQKVYDDISEKMRQALIDSFAEEDLDEEMLNSDFDTIVATKRADLNKRVDLERSKIRTQIKKAEIIQKRFRQNKGLDQTMTENQITEQQITEQIDNELQENEVFKNLQDFEENVKKMKDELAPHKTTFDAAQKHDDDEASLTATIKTFDQKFLKLMKSLNNKGIY